MTKKKPIRAGVPGRRSKRSPTAAKARAALLSAIDRACRARGEALWTNGYRTARTAYVDDDKESERLYDKEMYWLRGYTMAEKYMLRALTAYARAVRSDAR